ncbi:GNAT family N-acetyltransferase [uncultured Nisaea sp.]|uniref:GNAT family N-acetyltransferase n=1 Tax=uncultured Nisaea sp. TaxID=538215 RepID=UPI0030EF4C98|tara:strand:+ start:7074 stop:7550 length:477 start_codon:yes stop_codon:yes gene_type:complete
MIEVAGYRLVRDIETYLDDASGLHGAIFDRPWSRDDLQDLLVMPGTSGAAILSEGKGPAFAGFVLYQCVGDFAEILTLAVAPDHRRRGFGRWLMREAAEHAAAAGAEKLLLEVQDGNRSAIELYESLGMTTFDRRRNYYKSADGSHADAILMQLIFDI